MINRLNDFSFLKKEHEKMIFLEGFAEEIFNYTPETVRDFLCNIIEQETNSVIRHEAAFIIGTHIKFLSCFEDIIAKRLINVVKSEKSIVLIHEIIEAFGHFKSNVAIDFLQEMYTCENQDIKDTVIISLGRNPI